MKHYNICIIGAGASGCAAAITAAKDNKSVCILEKNKEVLRKVAATGNGKCNISNTNCENVREVVDFFETIGIYFAEEDEGRLYPYNRSASTVVEVMADEMKALGVEVYTETEVKEIKKGFVISTSEGRFEADKLLIAAGGKSGPQFGTTGDGYIFARKLGHKVSTLIPSLTAIECEGDFKKLKGIRALAKVTLRKDGKDIAQERGEVQFTEDGLSGICIFNLSRFLKIEKGEDFKKGIRRFTVSIDFLPEMDDEKASEVIRKLGLTSLLKKPLTAVVSENNIKDFEVTVTGVKGWKQSQVTAGGVSLDEIDMDTMESKVVPGLYFAGEVIDYDGPCGGYNLTNAWITGIKAGKAML